MAKKLFYKIGEACKKLDIQPYVLRYWETEFPFLKPSKSKSGQRVYSEEELAIIGRIKELLYEEGYTIAGAKKKLEVDLASDGAEPAASSEALAPAKGAKKPMKTKASGPRRVAEPSPKKKQPEGGTDPRLTKLEAGLAAAREQAQGILALLEPS